MAKKNALIFIPDISGFTKFVNDTDIEHSQHIIEELIEVRYMYIELSPLLSQLTVLPPPRDAMKYKNPVTVSILIEAPLHHVYTLVVDLGQRLEWSAGLDNITFDRTKIHRLGMRHVCELPGGAVELETIQNKIQDDRIEYAEKAVKSRLLPKATTFYIMEKNSEKTLFTAQFHYKRIFILGYFIDFFFRKRLSANFEKSAQNLKKYCENKFIKQ